MQVRPSSEATTNQRIAIVAKALEWVCMAQALVALHNPKYAANRLVDEGCPVAFLDGEVVVYHDDEWWWLAK